MLVVNPSMYWEIVFLALVAAFYIFIIEKRFALSYRLRDLKPLCVFSRKMYAGIVSGFIWFWPLSLPVVVFFLGMQPSSAGSNFFDKLSQGVLFSTTVSLAATLMTDSHRDYKSLTRRGNNEKETKRLYHCIGQATSVETWWPSSLNDFIPSSLLRLEKQASISSVWSFNFALYGSMFSYPTWSRRPVQGQEAAEEAGRKGDQESMTYKGVI